jgi:uncharacterized protein (DUF2141 family)
MKSSHWFFLFMLCIMCSLLACQNDKRTKQVQKIVEAEGQQKDTLNHREKQPTSASEVPMLSVCLDMASAFETHAVITVYREQDIFLQRTSCFKEIDCVLKRGQNCVSIEMPHGMYAIAVFIDDNGNNELDKNLIGMPTEGYGFSALEGAVLKVPQYRDCQFEFNEQNVRCGISLRNIR